MTLCCRSKEAVLHDIKVIGRNCNIFDHPGSLAARKAAVLFKLVEKLISPSSVDWRQWEQDVEVLNIEIDDYEKKMVHAVTRPCGVCVTFFVLHRANKSAWRQ